MVLYLLVSSDSVAGVLEVIEGETLSGPLPASCTIVVWIPLTFVVIVILNVKSLSFSFDW